MSEEAQTSSIALNEHENTITVRLVRNNPLQKYEGTYSYQSLPIEFRIIFENLDQFHEFIATDIHNRVRISDGKLYVLVNIMGKVKEFILPLIPLELTQEEMIKNQLWLLNNKNFENQKEIQELKKEGRKKDAIIEDLHMKVRALKDTLRQKDFDEKKMQSRLRHLENMSEDERYLEEEKGINQIPEEKLTQEFTPPKKTSSAFRNRKLKQLERFGIKMAFKIDPEAKHYQRFTITLGQVQKLMGPTYQLFHQEPLPKEGRFYFDIRTIKIKNSNIVVGIITDKNKDEQFSFKKMNCVCYNGYDGSICEQDKQNYVNKKPKEGNRIRTVVDMTIGIIDWYIIGKEIMQNPIGTAIIPPSMLKQPIYPYFQLYWQGNKVKLT